MTKVKILAVSDPDKAGKNAGAGTPPFCTDSQYIGQVGETTGGAVIEWGTGKLLHQVVRFDNDGDWLFAPDQLQEVAE